MVSSSNLATVNEPTPAQIARELGKAFSASRYDKRDAERAYYARLLEFMYHALTLESHSGLVYLPLPAHLWERAVLQDGHSTITPELYHIPVQEVIGLYAGWMDKKVTSRVSFPSVMLRYHDEATWLDRVKTVADAVGSYEAPLGGVVMPREKLDKHLNGEALTRNTESYVPMNGNIPFVKEATFKGRSGFLVSLRRYAPLHGQDHYMDYHAWYRPTVEEAMELAATLLELATNAAGEMYEVPREKRVSVPKYVNPVTLMLPLKQAW